MDLQSLVAKQDNPPKPSGDNEELAQVHILQQMDQIKAQNDEK